MWHHCSLSSLLTLTLDKQMPCWNLWIDMQEKLLPFIEGICTSLDAKETGEGPISTVESRNPFDFVQITCLSRAVAENFLLSIAKRLLAVLSCLCSCFILFWSLWFNIHYRHRPFYFLWILLYTEINICIFICFFMKTPTIQAVDSYLCAGQP